MKISNNQPLTITDLFGNEETVTILGLQTEAERERRKLLEEIRFMQNQIAEIASAARLKEDPLGSEGYAASVEANLSDIRRLLGV